LQRTGSQCGAPFQGPVGLGQARIHILVDVAHHLGRPHRFGIPRGPPHFQLGLGGHVRKRQALAPGPFRIGSPVAAQGLLDLQRLHFQTLELLGVVRVHRPQQSAQPAQGPRLAQARQPVGPADQAMRLLQQGAQSACCWQQGLHL